MTTLTTRARKRLPAAAFGVPSRRAYPMPDRAHAANAKARAAQQLAAGNLSQAEKERIDAMADRKLGKR
jgi:hypothetical protein